MQSNNALTIKSALNRRNRMAKNLFGGYATRQEQLDALEGAATGSIRKKQPIKPIPKPKPKAAAKPKPRPFVSIMLDKLLGRKPPQTPKTP